MEGFICRWAIIRIVFFAAIILSCGSRKSEPIKQKNFASTSESVVNGEKVFMVHCQKCHPAGEAGLGPAINPTPRFFKRFQVRHGMGVMPSFKKDEISEGDLRDISKFLATWKSY